MNDIVNNPKFQPPGATVSSNATGLGAGIDTIELRQAIVAEDPAGDDILGDNLQLIALESIEETSIAISEFIESITLLPAPGPAPAPAPEPDSSDFDGDAAAAPEQPPEWDPFL